MLQYSAVGGVESDDVGLQAVVLGPIGRNTNDSPQFSLACGRVSKHSNMIANFEFRHISSSDRENGGQNEWQENEHQGVIPFAMRNHMRQSKGLRDMGPIKGRTCERGHYGLLPKSSGKPHAPQNVIADWIPLEQFLYLLI